MRRTFAAVVALLAVSGAWAQSGGIGTSPANPKHIGSRFFKIPFGLPQNAQTIRQLKLFRSSNGGATWDLDSTAGPFAKQFEVKVEHDGPYAFAIQTVFSNGDLLPLDVTGLVGKQFVVVDTEKPAILLKPLPTRPGNPGHIEVGVQWDVRDENLDPTSVRLEVRWAGQGPFRRITDRAIGPQGEDTRTIESFARMEVRLTARDFAGNLAEQTIIVGGGMTTGLGNEPPPRDPAALAGSPGRAQTKFLNSKTVVLEFRVTEKGQSGIASSDLWITRDGRDWHKAEKANIKMNDKEDKVTATYEATDDGLYGFALIATSRANLSQPPPTSSRDVQVFVKVDTKAPEAKLVEVKFAQPIDPQYLTISWQASDENLGATPISLQYALEENPTDGSKWRDLTEDPLTNTGRQVVKTPGIPGFQFWVRLRVVDLAGNETIVKYPKPVILDLVRPRVEVTDAKRGE